MAFLLATAVTCLCVYFSLRALRNTVDATAVNPREVARVLRIGESREKAKRLFTWAKNEPVADLERDLLEAMTTLEGEVQVAHVNAVLTEVDHRLHVHLRVPRVCARLSSSVGLLCGAMALRHGLVEGSLDLPPSELLLHGPIADLLAAVLMGISGAVWCASAARAVKKIADERLSAEDVLVERLEAVFRPASPATATGPTGSTSDTSDTSETSETSETNETNETSPSPSPILPSREHG